MQELVLVLQHVVLYSQVDRIDQASETLGGASVLGEGIGHGPSVVRGLPAHVGHNPTCLSYPGFLA
jgi:hypothetical protein